MELCRTGEEFLYLANKLRDSSSRYYQKFAAGLFLKYGDEDLFVEIQSRNLEYGSDYLALANYYMKKGQTDKAIQLAETAVKKIDTRLDEVYEWLFWIYRNNWQEEKLILLYQAAQKKNRNLDTITRLMIDSYASNYGQKKPCLLRMPAVCRSEEMV